MGRRSRQRAREGRQADPLSSAPTTDYASPDGEQVLTLRGAMTAGSRVAYGRALAGEERRAGGTQAREDAGHRAVELLFERLAVRWTISGVPTEGQKELLQRLRVASNAERRWIRDTLREHVAEHFPGLPAP